MKRLLLGCLFLINTAFAAWPHEHISQSTFALNVANRMPQNRVSEIDNNTKKIFFYTNLRNLKGQAITHRWVYKGTSLKVRPRTEIPAKCTEFLSPLISGCHSNKGLPSCNNR
jgi:hypothetical protein